MALLFAPAVPAIDSLSIGIGDGASDAVGPGTDGEILLVGLGWKWPEPVVQGDRLQLLGYWEVDLAYTRSKGEIPGDNMFTVGGGPMWRYTSRFGTTRPFLDFGVGVHLISDTQFGVHVVSTVFQFSPNVGFGIRSGRYEFGYQLWHLSNAGIRQPNPGLNFHNLRFAVHF